MFNIASLVVFTNMSNIVIYTTSLCPYCRMAKGLMERKGVEFDEIDVTGKPEVRSQMVEKSGGRLTVPQIWIGEDHVGGYDDLVALDRSGKLDQMLMQ